MFFLLLLLPSPSAPLSAAAGGLIEATAALSISSTASAGGRSGKANGTPALLSKDSEARSECAQGGVGGVPVENLGVAPDVAVANSPLDLERGADAVLEAAVRIISRNIRALYFSEDD